MGGNFGGRKLFGGIPVNAGFGGNILVAARPKGFVSKADCILWKSLNSAILVEGILVVEEFDGRKPWWEQMLVRGIHLVDFPGLLNFVIPHHQNW